MYHAQDDIICHHMGLLRPSRDQKLKNPFVKKNSDKGLFKCVMCDKYSVNSWFCLNDGCLYICCDNTINNHINNHLQEMKDIVESDPHCIFINPITTQIYCFECKTEIYDIETYKKDYRFDKWMNPLKLREIYKGLIASKETGTKIQDSLSYPKMHSKTSKGICGLVNLGNTNYINALTHALAAVPSIKEFFTSYYKRYQNLNLSFGAKSNRKLAYKFSETIQAIWSGNWRVFKPEGFVQALYELNSYFKSYAPYEIQELFRFMINSLHDEFKILIHKSCELGLTPIINTKLPDDEWAVMDNLNDYLENSLITDTFQGKMLSNFKCDRCQEQINLEEYFTYLELRIPQTRDPAKLKKWGIEDAPPELLQEPKPKGTWLAGMFKNQAQTNLYIYDCLIDFFETKVIRPFGNLYCEKCRDKTPYQKTYRILNLPNVLCFNLRRKGLESQDNHKVYSPPDELDMGPFLACHNAYQQSNTTYELISFVEERIIDNRTVHYAYCRNQKYKQWVGFCDHEVLKVDEKNLFSNKALMLFYQKKMPIERIKEMRNIKSQVKLLKTKELSVDSQKIQYGYLPNYWYEKGISLANPGMIHTVHLLCKHGKLKPSYYDCFPPKNKLNSSSQDLSFSGEKSFIEFSLEDAVHTVDNIEKQSVKLPKEILEYLIEKYGGGPYLRNMDVCIDCANMALNVRQRRKMERDLIAKYDNKPSPVYYAINQTWIDLWKNFLYTNSRFLRKNFTKGYSLPPPITNEVLFESPQKIRIGLVKGTDYRMVNQWIWKIFKELYGAGPEIIRKDKDLYAPEGKDYSPDLPKTDKEMIAEMKNLLKEEIKSESLSITSPMINILKDAIDIQPEKDDEDNKTGFNNVKGCNGDKNFEEEKASSSSNNGNKLEKETITSRLSNDKENIPSRTSFDQISERIYIKNDIVENGVNEEKNDNIQGQNENEVIVEKASVNKKDNHDEDFQTNTLEANTHSNGEEQVTGGEEQEAGVEEEGVDPNEQVVGDKDEKTSIDEQEIDLNDHSGDSNKQKSIDQEEGTGIVEQGVKSNEQKIDAKELTEHIKITNLDNIDNEKDENKTIESTVIEIAKIIDVRDFHQ